MKLERKERPGDRNRPKIHTHGEAVRPTFESGMVKVECKSLNAARALKRRGFVEVPEVPAAEAAPARPKPKAKAKSKPKTKAKSKAKSKGAPKPKAEAD